MDDYPAVRGSHVRQNIAAAAIIGQDAVQRFREASPPKAIAALERAGRLGFVPVEIDVETFLVGLELFGPKDNQRRVRHALASTFNSPLMKPVVDGTLRLFGVGPGSMFRLSAPAWATVYRSCGCMSRESTEEGRVVLRCRDAAPAMLEHYVYLEGVAAAIGAVMDVCRVEGGVTLDEVDYELRTVTFIASWRPGSMR